MLRVLPVLLSVGLTIYCLIEAIQTDEAEMRNLPKPIWILLILLFPVVGPVAWLVAGRPTTAGPRRQVPWPAGATSGFPDYERPTRLAPDDDPEFLAGLSRLDTEHKRMLEQWEADLRERERRLRGEDRPAEGSPDPDEPPGDDRPAPGR